MHRDYIKLVILSFRSTMVHGRPPLGIKAFQFSNMNYNDLEYDIGFFTEIR